MGGGGQEGEFIKCAHIHTHTPPPPSLLENQVIALSFFFPLPVFSSAVDKSLLMCWEIVDLWGDEHFALLC